MISQDSATLQQSTSPTHTPLRLACNAHKKKASMLTKSGSNSTGSSDMLAKIPPASISANS